MNNCKPEFEAGTTVTYMPHERAYQATVLTYRYIGAGAHPDEIQYLLRVDDDVLEAFRERSDNAGKGYQTMINDALRDYLGKSTQVLDEDTLRRVIREEIKQTG